MQRTISKISVDRYRADNIRRQKAVEQFFLPKILKAIVDEYKRAVESVKENGSKYTRNHLSTIIKIEPIVNLLKSLYIKSAIIQAKYVGSYIKKNRINKFRTFGVSLDQVAPVVDDYFSLYLFNNSAVPIDATTKKIILRRLLDEIDSGKPLDQALKDFEDYAIAYGRRIEDGAQPSLDRAKLIATTETTRAMSFGGMIGAYMTGVDLDKMWVTCDDERVRDPNHDMYRGQKVPFPHTKLDLQEAELFGSFYNGEYIKFPGDPDASISNTVRCRCSLLFLEKEDGLDDDTSRTIDNFLNAMTIGSL